MIRVGKLSLGAAPRIVAGFKDKVPAAVIHDAAKRGLDIAELRIDQYASFKPDDVLREIKRFTNFPTIATIRSRKEGGRWNLSEEKRLLLFKAVMPEVDAVDIELSSQKILRDVVKAARSEKKTVLISYHNFKRTPGAGELDSVFKKALSAGADIVKIAAFANKKEDVQALARFTLACQSKNIVTIAMGRRGMVSRIFFPALGSLMTYAYAGKQSLAPGQLDFSVTTKLFRLFYPK